MKQNYVPLEKRSKKQQKEFHDLQRKGWGDINPVTRKKESKKVYNRKKSERWQEYGPGSDFLFSGLRSHIEGCVIPMLYCKQELFT